MFQRPRRERDRALHERFRVMSAARHEEPLLEIELRRRRERTRREPRLVPPQRSRQPRIEADRRAVVATGVWVVEVLLVAGVRAVHDRRIAH